MWSVVMFVQKQDVDRTNVGDVDLSTTAHSASIVAATTTETAGAAWTTHWTTAWAAVASATTSGRVETRLRLAILFRFQQTIRQTSTVDAPGCISPL